MGFKGNKAALPSKSCQACGRVAPTIERTTAIAFGPSSTAAMTGDALIVLTRSS